MSAFLAKSGVAQSGNPCPKLTALCALASGVNSDHTVGASKPAAKEADYMIAWTMHHQNLTSQTLCRRKATHSCPNNTALYNGRGQSTHGSMRRRQTIPNWETPTTHKPT
jgi:hypothetical protein